MLLKINKLLGKQAVKQLIKKLSQILFNLTTTPSVP
jgi:hypothetical protein